MAEMNNSTKRYLEYIVEHNSALGAREALGDVVLRSVDFNFVARLLGKETPGTIIIEPWATFSSNRTSDVAFDAPSMERYWSGGTQEDKDVVPSIDVFVDGAKIRIGAMEGGSEGQSALIDVTLDEVERLIKTLQAALIRARQWEAAERKRGNL